MKEWEELKDKCPWLLKHDGCMVNHWLKCGKDPCAIYYWAKQAANDKK